MKRLEGIKIEGIYLGFYYGPFLGKPYREMGIAIWDKINNHPSSFNHGFGDIIKKGIEG